MRRSGGVGIHRSFKNFRILRFMRVQISPTALIKDNVYRLFIFIFFHLVFYFIITGKIPDYSSNQYIPFIIAAIIIILAITSKPRKISFDKSKKRVYNRIIKQKKSRKAKKIIKTPSL